MNLRDFGSGSSKRLLVRKDTRNTWVLFMFVTHKRKNNFRKESTQRACAAGLRENEQYGFVFGPIGFGGTHVHFRVNIPKKYSVTNAEVMLKRTSAARIFTEKPNFLKLYPDRQFWSGYEHHESIGADMDVADRYIRNQEQHHSVVVIRDVQSSFSPTAASGDTAAL
ncbi:MAG: transposase [Candidatus Aenigmarchaeota archaeon]|nr:transposase [Candidatus Aenigmarchaeota archaeon]